jgi:hypothetical protein
MPNRMASLLFLAGTLVCLGASVGACKSSNVTTDAATADRFVAPGTGGSGGQTTGGDGGSGGQASGGQSGGGGPHQGGGGGGGSGGTSGKGGASGRDASAGKDASQAKDAAVEAPSTIDGGTVSCDDITSPGRLAVYYYSDSAASGSSIQIHLDIVNYTAFSSKLSQVTLRYWFTDEARAIDAGSLPNVIEQYYVPVATTMKFITLDPPRAGADTVLEMSYSNAPDAGTSWVETRGFNFAFHKTSYNGTYDQSNDYSYDATLKSTLGLNPRITAYVGGVLAWGCEPPAN